MQHFTDVPPMVVENLLSGVIFPAMLVSFLIGAMAGFGLAVVITIRWVRKS